VIRRSHHLALSLIVVAVLIVFTTVTAAWSADIKFDGKNFLDNGEVVGIAGTIKGEGVIYKNNTYAIRCMQSNRECTVTSIEQIGDNLMGRLEYPYDVPVIVWGKNEVIASNEVLPWTCVKTTITILRSSQTATWVDEGTNVGKQGCGKERWVHRRSID
jgi:hypothetical protein